MTDRLGNGNPNVGIYCTVRACRRFRAVVSGLVLFIVLQPRAKHLLL